MADLSNVNVTDPQTLIADKLSLALLDFVDALKDVYPQDTLIQQAYTKAQTLDKKALCAAVCTSFAKEDLMKAQDRNADIFAHESLKAYDAQSKYASATEDIRETVWQYLKNIADAALI